MLRNRELRQFFLIFLLISVAVVILGFLMGTEMGILSIVTTVSLGTVFYVFTKMRYQKIARLSEQIDKVLHNEDHLYIEDSQEGELSILQSEITKMTLRIREQNAALKKEKNHLADSLADIAHQLGTPLTSLNLIVSLLENDTDENQRRDLLREAEELLMRMEWLNTSLLKLSRLDAGVVVFRKERTEVKRLIDAALRPLLIPLELHDITLQINVPEEIIISGDSGWLTEAIQNILKNCMESAGDGGTIEIACEDTLLFTEITVRDNGEGFQKEDLSHLFDRFYRGKNSDAAGYGIGLALCKTIITQQGGTLTAKNHPQGGAIFSIRFPK